MGDETKKVGALLVLTLLLLNLFLLLPSPTAKGEPPLIGTHYGDNFKKETFEGGINKLTLPVPTYKEEGTWTPVNTSLTVAPQPYD